VGYQRHDRGAQCIGQARALFERFTGRPPERVVRRPFERCAPQVLVELGELRALVYRSARRAGESGAVQNYVHHFDTPPRLFADPAGQRLFIAGGRFRVTRRGIEG
jgi:hypothetical protein